MALTLADRVKETTTTEGTGALALAGAVNGFSSFSSRLAVGDITFYAVILGTQWEVGLGKLTAASTLERTTVLASSNADTPVSFAAGSKEVFIDFPAVIASRLSDFAISESTVASAATVDLGAQNSRKIAISGTTAITSFGTFKHGEKLLRFTGACTLTHDATALILPTGANIVTAPGDTALATSDASGNWRIRHYQRADGSSILPALFGQCRLSATSATALILKQCFGNLLWINGANRIIPSAGLTLSNSGLAASTVYYIFAYWTGAAIALEASTTGHQPDSALGNEVKQGDATRSLVGAAVTDAAGKFQDAAGARGVATWFNKQWLPIQGGTVNLTSGSTAVIELSPPNGRAFFFSWGSDAVDLTVSGYSYNTSAGVWTLTGVGLDSVIGKNGQQMNGASYLNQVSVLDQRTPPEGWHYGCPMGQVQGATGGWNVTVGGKVLM